MKTSNKILLTIFITFITTILLVSAALRINATKVRVELPGIVNSTDTTKDNKIIEVSEIYNNKTSDLPNEKNPSAVTKEINLDTFNSIAVGGFYNITIQKSDKSKILMQGDATVLKLLDINVKNNTLTIDSPKDFNWFNTKPIDITIFTNNLNNIAIGGKVMLKDMDVDSSSLELHVGGRAYCTLAGKTKTFTLNLGGNAKIDAKNLIADAVEISVAGQNSIVVHANESLHINGVGNNEIYYYGDPKNFTNNLLGWNNVVQMK